MNILYPACEPFAVHKINVGDAHELYVEECGNPSGIPVLFLHGGPGSGCQPAHRRYFDPEAYRILLFDQRGCGRSRPLGETRGNRTGELVSDMEAIRQHLKIARWLVFGGSWGVALGLVYALTHSRFLHGLVLRGTFLARESDLQWFFIGLRHLFPQAWQGFTMGMGDNPDLDVIIGDYYAAVHGRDAERSLEAARRWSEWGSTVVNWHRQPIEGEREPAPETADQRWRLVAKARIETHYAKHRYFIQENEILKRIGELPELPVSIVHGQYDLTCTLEAAWLLHNAIPGSRLIQVPGAGHLIDEPAMVSALIEETDRMRRLV